MTRGPRVNDLIRKTPIRLIDEHNEMIGVVETADALNRARDAGLDLVEVHADSDPPVCRITDYGKLRYEQSKKEKANKAKSKQAELKEVRLGRSMKIDPHDIMIRMNQARKFLMEGHKVQIVQNFRGREMIHRQKGFERLKDLALSVEEIAKVEMPARLNGRRMLMILAPDKAKIEAIKRKLAAEKAAAGIVEDEEPEDEVIEAADLIEDDLDDDDDDDETDLDDAHEAVGQDEDSDEDSDEDEDPARKAGAEASTTGD